MPKGMFLPNGRKAISSHVRPTVNELEAVTLAPGAGAQADAAKAA